MSLETRRIKLDDKLREILGNDHVYFQPPDDLTIKYPCIVYAFVDMSGLHADDKKYIDEDKYTLTLITKDPLPEILESLDALPYCSMDRHYTSDNLHHFSFSLSLMERI